MDGFECVIGADILPTKSNRELFAKGNAECLVGKELCERLCRADFRVFNLEGPLTNSETPIRKSGPVLRAPENCIMGIKALEPNLLVLANNHILDHGETGAKRTVSVLEDNALSYIGIGKTAEERRKAHIFEKNGVKVAVYNCCEHEFSVRAEGVYGANPYDALYAFDDVASLKKTVDFVLVLYHGGKEYVRYPSPTLMRVFRKFADSGASAVIAQHTHCIGTYEHYGKSLLVYGQGNFLFDIGSSEFLDEALLVSLCFHSDKTMEWEFIPICKNGATVRLLPSNKKAAVLSALEERSSRLQDSAFIQTEYKKKSLEHLRGYLLNMHMGIKLDTIGIRLFLRLPQKLREKVFRKKMEHLLALKNYISCEAHRELLLEGLEDLLGLSSNIAQGDEFCH